MLIALVVTIAAFGLAALYLHQPARRSPLARPATVAFVLVTTATLALAVGNWSSAQGFAAPNVKAASLATVRALVKASNRLVTVPKDLEPPLDVALTHPDSNWGAATVGSCAAELDASTVPSCVFGDTHGTHTMVLYGDSHAAQWFDALNDIAKVTHWRLVLLTKGDCPAAPLSSHEETTRSGEFAACARWHSYAIARINRIDPDMLVVSQEVYQSAVGTWYRPSQWRKGMVTLLRDVHAQREIVLGDIPGDYGVACLVTKTVRACSTNPTNTDSPYRSAERTAAQSVGAMYVDVIPWFCANRCSPVIGHFAVYWDRFHVGALYTRFLEGVLKEAIAI